MASNTRRNWQMSLERDVSIEQDQRAELGRGVSWGGIWAGVLVALGTLLLLSTLGLAVGIAAGNATGGVNAGTGGVSPGTVGTAAVIWSALSLLISMFLGGLASTRMGRITNRSGGMFHGGLVWVITLGAILYLGVRGLELAGTGSSMGLGGTGAGLNGAGSAATEAANAATGHETSIGWSPFFIAALSLLAALAGSSWGLRRDSGRSSYGSGGSNYSSDRDYSSGGSIDSSSSSTTTTTTRVERDKDQDRY
jgi:hypothetical protein